DLHTEPDSNWNAAADGAVFSPCDSERSVCEPHRCATRRVDCAAWISHAACWSRLTASRTVIGYGCCMACSIPGSCDELVWPVSGLELSRAHAASVARHAVSSGVAIDDDFARVRKPPTACCRGMSSGGSVSFWYCDCDISVRTTLAPRQLGDDDARRRA